jgi:hypothetical protein
MPAAACNPCLPAVRRGTVFSRACRPWLTRSTRALSSRAQRARRTCRSQLQAQTRRRAALKRSHAAAACCGDAATSAPLTADDSAGSAGDGTPSGSDASGGSALPRQPLARGRPQPPLQASRFAAAPAPGPSGTVGDAAALPPPPPPPPAPDAPRLAAAPAQAHMETAAALAAAAAAAHAHAQTHYARLLALRCGESFLQLPAAPPPAAPPAAAAPAPAPAPPRPCAPAAAATGLLGDIVAAGARRPAAAPAPLLLLQVASPRASGFPHDFGLAGLHTWPFTAEEGAHALALPPERLRTAAGLSPLDGAAAAAPPQPPPPPAAS